MERCVFCGWNRRTAFSSVRFFNIPKDPGLKRMQWLYAIGTRELGPRDRVCSVHFRSGKPSGDPSHSDFAPHLYLNKEPPPEVINYLEQLADAEATGASAPAHPQYKASVSVNNPTHVEFNKVAKPSILRRKRKNDERESSAGCDEEEEAEDNRPISTSYSMGEIELNPGELRAVRLYRIQDGLVKAASLRAGMRVLVKVPREPKPPSVHPPLAHPPPAHLPSVHPPTVHLPTVHLPPPISRRPPQHAPPPAPPRIRHPPVKRESPPEPDEGLVRIRMEDEHGNVLEERLVTEEEAIRIQEEVQKKVEQSRRDAAEEIQNSSPEQEHSEEIPVGEEIVG